jgi:hypothetical protein
MEVRVFDRVRQTLLDQTENGKKARSEIAQFAGPGKITLGAATAIATMLTIASLVCAITHPVLGCLGLMFWGALSLMGRDMFVLASNLEKLTSDSGFFGNITNRAAAAATPRMFIQTLFNETWVAGSLFSEMLIQKLERATAKA